MRACLAFNGGLAQVSPYPLQPPSVFQCDAATGNADWLKWNLIGLLNASAGIKCPVRLRWEAPQNYYIGEGRGIKP